MKKLIAGNWKMNGTRASVAEVSDLAARLTAENKTQCDVLVCPPAPILSAAVAAAKGSAVMIGGQDCHANASGAHTGDISAEMLADIGAGYVIVGHSERRADHGETDEIVQSKAKAAARAGLVPIVCVGENLDQRQAGKAVTTVAQQVERSLPADLTEFALAYEPVWAIGTGVAAEEADIAEMHSALRSMVGSGVRLLYGGSVKPANAGSILTVADVDGALVGGASLTAVDFHGIVDALCS